MITVNAEQFQFIKNKLTTAPTFVHSILDEVIEGAVYADSTNYDSLFFQSAAGLFFVTGDSSNKTLLNGIRIAFEKAVLHNKRFTLFSYTSCWDEAIQALLDDKIRKIERYTFSFDESIYQNSIKSSSTYEVQSINRINMMRSAEFNEHYFNIYWDSVDNFLTYGMGFCMMDGERIISEAVAIFKSQRYAEIDIMTDADYRGQGLASVVAERFIDECLAQNIIPCWDCDIENSGSVKLGRKLGFVRPTVYSVYIKASHC